MNKTTLLLNQMTEDLCRSEHSSCMTVVPLDQNVKTYTTTQCKVLRILKVGVTVFICASLRLLIVSQFSLQQQTGEYVVTIPLTSLALFSTLYPGGTDEYSYTHFHMLSLRKNNKT